MVFPNPGLPNYICKLAFVHEGENFPTLDPNCVVAKRFWVNLAVRYLERVWPMLKELILEEPFRRSCFSIFASFLQLLSEFRTGEPVTYSVIQALWSILGVLYLWIPGPYLDVLAAFSVGFLRIESPSEWENFRQFRVVASRMRPCFWTCFLSWLQSLRGECGFL